MQSTFSERVDAALEEGAAVREECRAAMRDVQASHEAVTAEQITATQNFGLQIGKTLSATIMSFD